MLNLKTVTQGVETLLKNNLGGYTIQRNVARNVDPNMAAKGNGWIGIYRDSLEYRPHGTVGHMAIIGIRVEVQVASMKSADIAEDKLQDAEADILAVLNNDKKLSGTVDMTTGYEIAYEYNADEEIYHHAAVISIRAEARVT